MTDFQRDSFLLLSTTTKKKNKLQIITSKKRGVSLSKVSQFYLGPVTSSIANVDGTTLKTVKSKLFDEIEKDLKHYLKWCINI